MLSRLAAPVAAAALVATGLVAAPAGADFKAPPRPSYAAKATPSKADRATAALAKAKALFAGRSGKAARPGREATLVLRDLAVLRPALTPAQRAEADRILARPTDGAGDPIGEGYTVAEETPVCGTHVCIHYVTNDVTPNVDSVSPTDANTNGIPDYVEKARSTMEHVWTTYSGAGYRSPKADGTLGGSAKFDVYLAQIGDEGLYGYCTTDEPGSAPNRWAYCVLDNDFKHAEFPTNTPVENLQVTAAHEFFHAVQYAYDVNEDAWFMEATATWAEDELYDDVNDNRQYLPSGQLGQPLIPLDVYSGSVHYGNWIFFRYLSEKWPTKAGGMPTIVRSMWRLADATPGAADKYSMTAIKSVLSSKKTNLSKEFSLFTAKNRFSRKFYAEGAKGRYPQTAIGQTLSLSQRGFTNRGDFTMNHLTSYSVRVNPSRVTGSRKLQVQVWLPSSHHSDTSVVVDWISKKGKHTFKIVKVNGSGQGSVKVPFANAKTQGIVATVVNSGTHYVCDMGTGLSCQGTSLDDSLTIGMKFKTVA
ncbi:MAG: MXAN_6640 family putative metalloprotease [Nocardioidaceae bacterium]